MYKIVLFFLSGLSFVPICFGQAPASSNPLLTNLDKKVDAEVRHFMKHEKMVGVAVGILKKGTSIFYGYGETERGNMQLPDEHTIFEIGSITKTFTATLLAYAVNDGILSLDDPINKYLPDSIPRMEYKGIPVTLKTLSNHTSGIPEFPTNFHFPDEKYLYAGDPFKDYSDSDLFSFYVHFRLQRRPGEKLEYSSLAVATLGVIMERIYKMRYDSLIMDRICNPLGMNDTRVSSPMSDSLRVAKGYAPDGVAASAWSWKAFAGAGGLRSTASDLLKYAAANMGEAPPVLNKAIMLTHQTTYKQKGGGVGLGWEIDSSGHYDWLMHNGGTGGFGSFLIFDPQKHLAVVILANKNKSGEMEDLGGSIMKWLEESVRQDNHSR